MVPSDVLVPRAKGVFVSPDGGVAQLGATLTAATMLASPTLSSAHLTVRFMLPPDLGRLAISDVGEQRRYGVPAVGRPVRRGPVATVTACSSLARTSRPSRPSVPPESTKARPKNSST